MNRARRRSDRFTADLGLVLDAAPRLDPVQESLAWLERDAGGPLASAAVNALTLHHLRLVVSVLKRMGEGLDLDVFQECSLAVRQCVLAFDRRRGVQFSTLAGRAVLRKAVNVRKMAGRKRVRRLLSSPYGSPRRELVPDTVALAMDQRSDAARLRRAVARLPLRERQVIERFYGLDGGEPATLTAIGRSFAPPVSRDQVGLILRRGLTQAGLHLTFGAARGEIEGVA